MIEKDREARSEAGWTFKYHGDIAAAVVWKNHARRRGEYLLSQRGTNLTDTTYPVPGVTVEVKKEGKNIRVRIFAEGDLKYEFVSSDVIDFGTKVTADYTDAEVKYVKGYAFTLDVTKKRTRYTGVVSDETQQNFTSPKQLWTDLKNIGPVYVDTTKNIVRGNKYVPRYYQHAASRLSQFFRLPLTNSPMKFGTFGQVPARVNGRGKIVESGPNTDLQQTDPFAIETASSGGLTIERPLHPWHASAARVETDDGEFFLYTDVYGDKLYVYSVLPTFPDPPEVIGVKVIPLPTWCADPQAGRNRFNSGVQWQFSPDGTKMITVRNKQTPAFTLTGNGLTATAENPLDNHFVDFNSPVPPPGSVPTTIASDFDDLFDNFGSRLDRRYQLEPAFIEIEIEIEVERDSSGQIESINPILTISDRTPLAINSSVPHYIAADYDVATGELVTVELETYSDASVADVESMEDQVVRVEFVMIQHPNPTPDQPFPLPLEKIRMPIFQGRLNYSLGAGFSDYEGGYREGFLYSFTSPEDVMFMRNIVSMDLRAKAVFTAVSHQLSGLQGAVRSFLEMRYFGKVKRQYVYASEIPLADGWSFAPFPELDPNDPFDEDESQIPDPVRGGLARQPNWSWITQSIRSFFCQGTDSPYQDWSVAPDGKGVALCTSSILLPNGYPSPIEGSFFLASRMMDVIYYDGKRSKIDTTHKEEYRKAREKFIELEEPRPHEDPPERDYDYYHPAEGSIFDEPTLVSVFFPELYHIKNFISGNLGSFRTAGLWFYSRR